MLHKAVCNFLHPHYDFSSKVALVRPPAHLIRGAEAEGKLVNLFAPLSCPAAKRLKKIFPPEKNGVKEGGEGGYI